MQGIINLVNPITVNGKPVTELRYNTMEITGALFCEADSKRRLVSGAKNVSIAPAVEFDFGMHVYLGYAACVAADPTIDMSDLERIHGSDIVKIMAVGRNFIMNSEDSTQSNSDEPSETTAAPTTQA